MSPQESLGAFASRIDSYLLAAGDTAPSGPDLLRYFKNGLRPNLRIGVWTAGTPASYGAALKAAEQFELLLHPPNPTSRPPTDHKQHDRNRGGRGASTKPALSKKALSAFLTDAGLSPEDRAPILALLSGSRSPGTGKPPASPGTSGIPKMTPAIRQECIDRALCFRCREPLSAGHVGATCPAFPDSPAKVPDLRRTAATLGRRTLASAAATPSDGAAGGEEEPPEAEEAPDLSHVSAVTPGHDPEDYTPEELFAFVRVREGGLTRGEAREGTSLMGRRNKTKKDLKRD